jgi:hypothetical protein
MSVKANQQLIKHNILSFVEADRNWIEKRHPELSLEERVDVFLAEEIQMEEAMKSFIEYEGKIANNNQNLLRIIKELKGEEFHADLCNILEDSDRIGEMSIVEKTTGDYQQEDYSHIAGVWVDQRSVGDSGDSFEGFLYVQLEADKYLRIPYSM